MSLVLVILDGLRTAQNHSKATHHRKGDLGAIDQIHLDRHYRAADLLNLLRSRTYPPYPAAHAIEDGQRNYCRIDCAISPAYFEQPFGRTHTRTVPVDELLIDTRANPPGPKITSLLLQMVALSARSADGKDSAS